MSGCRAQVLFCGVVLLLLAHMVCSTDSAEESLWGQFVLEQSDDTCEDAFPLLEMDLWVEGLEPYRRRRPYRNPLRRLRKRMRRAARQQRKAVRRALRLRDCGEAAPATVPPTVAESAAAAKASKADTTFVPQESVVARSKRGRKAAITTNHIFCPTEGCRGHNQLGPHPNHWIVGAGTYKTSWGDVRQMFQCQWCGKRVSETRGTVFFGLKTPQETIYRAVACLTEGLGIRATARVFEVKVDTILLWLKRAGQHSEKVSFYLMRKLHVDQAQLDELWTFVRKKEKRLSTWEKFHSEYGDTWVWTVFDPTHKLVLALLVGEREESQAVSVLERLVLVLAEGCLPFLTSDKLPHYVKAILKVFGHWVQPMRKGSRGRFPKPQLEPPEELHYGTVHKKRQNGRVVSVTTQVVFGKAKDLWTRLSALGVKKINTSFVERMNLTLRHLVSRLRRRGLTFSKKRQFLECHLQLAVAYYHFVLTHRGLRRRLPKPIPTKGNGSPKKWEKRTPSMSAGLTDHVWTIQELLTFRVPQATPPD